MRATAGFHAHDAVGRQGRVFDQELGVLAGIDVVGDYGDLVLVAHVFAQGFDQGRFAGTDRAADADAECSFLAHFVLL